MVLWFWFYVSGLRQMQTADLQTLVGLNNTPINLNKNFRSACLRSARNNGKGNTMDMYFKKICMSTGLHLTQTITTGSIKNA